MGPLQIVLVNDWFKYNHEVHTYSTTSASAVNLSHFFDVGSVEPTFNLYVQKSRLEKYGKKMIRVSGPIFWNMLPIDIQASLSLQSFKSRVKKHFISQYN